MKKTSNHFRGTGKIILFSLLITCMVLSMTGLSARSVKAAPQGAPSRQELMVRCLNVDDVRSVNARGNGNLGFVGAGAGRSIPQPQALQPDALPDQAARAYLNDCGSLFGIQDASGELTTERSTELEDGRSTVRFQQTYQGIPILGGEMIVQMDKHKNIQALVNKTTRASLESTTPTIEATAAQQTALQAIANVHQLDESTLTATDPQLWIYEPALLNASDAGPTILVWRMEVISSEAPVDEFVLVDAQNGTVVLNFNQIDTLTAAREPILSQAAETGSGQDEGVLPTAPVSIYTMNHGTGTLPGTLVCTETNSSACSETDAQKAYQWSVATFNFYSTTHNRNSINDAGMRIKSSVHYGTNYVNAFWNGSQMVFGDGFSVAEDVIGHELTHGVTQYESNLFYYYQSGAINESFSDLWGEFVEQTTTGNNNDWQLGEDLPAIPGVFAGGPIRDMADPTLFDNPDKMTSPYYYTGTGDNGGVHYNSGVNNKAVYLMTAGGTFNGYDYANGLGKTKVAKIYYEAQTNLLTSGSDYNDLYNALYQACLNLVGTSGITTDNCTQVRNATLAVEMNKQPVTNFNPEAPVCASGLTPSNLFSDDLESGLGNFTTGYTTGTTQWSLTTGYAHSGTKSLWADDQISTATDSYVRMTTGVTLPTGAYLHFAHAYEFDSYSTYDGGVVEYSTNSGSSWTDASSLFDYNGYNGTISSSSNPLNGRSAFTKLSHGYISSRLTLSSLSGKSVLFRWRMATNASGSGLGWLVDDIRIYTCYNPTTPPAAPSNLVATAHGQTQIDLTWIDNSSNETGFRVERSPAGANTWSLVATADANAISYSDTTVSCKTAYDYRLLAANTYGNSAASNTASATTAACPAPTAPSDLTADASGTNQVDLTWTDASDNETGFKIQRSPAGAGTWSLVATANAGAISYSDTTVACGTAYDYRIVATNNGSDSTPSNTGSATTWDCEIPAAPGDLTAAASGTNQVDLAWADNSDDETGFKVERSPAGAETWSLVATADAEAISYTDTSATCGTTYDYRVRATNQDGDSDPSNTATAATWVCTIPAAPGSLAASAASSTRVNLTWADNSNNETGFRVERSPAGANTWSQIATPAAGAVSYSDTAASCNTAYSYRVMAVNVNVYSDPSNTATVTTQSCLPGAFAKSKPATGATGQPNSLTLSWASSANATSYEYCVHLRSTTTSNSICPTSWTSTSTATSKTLSGLTPGATYYWQVRARNANGTTEANAGVWWTFSISPRPGLFNKTSPANAAANQPTSLTLKWGASLAATSYEYCIDKTNDNICNATWISTGTAISKALSGLTPGTYYWQVRARNTATTTITYANGGSSSAPWWSFSIAALPAAFNKTSPSNGNGSQTSAPTLKWGASSRALSYQYCIDTSNNSTCNATWVSTGTATSKTLSGLTPGSYYWQVRAKNNTGYTYANGSSTVWWSFIIPALKNGTFESGPTYWTEYSTHGWTIIMSGFPVPPHSGSYAAWLGGGNNETSYIQQQVTVPASTPYLVYWHWISSVDSCGSDYGAVLVNSAIVNKYYLCSSSSTNSWVKHTVYLGAYAGKTVTLQIRSVTNSALNSNLFVDDISFQPSAPTTMQPDMIVTIPDPSSAQPKSTTAPKDGTP